MKTKEEFVKGKNNIGYVWDSFIKEFGEDEIVPGSVLKPQKLSRDMQDSEILSEFSIQECTLGDVLETLKSATDDMKDGYSNIFYIKDHPSRVVGVFWRGGEWYVGGWGRGGDTWGVGVRVFSSATSPEKLSTLDSETLTLEKAIKLLKDNGYKVSKDF